uniref:Uncharacterized protein n=1 Tax=Zea mays TaxID=4577 RepID=A0A804M504_MAIZE
MARAIPQLGPVKEQNLGVQAQHEDERSRQPPCFSSATANRHSATARFHSSCTPHARARHSPVPRPCLPTRPLILTWPVGCGRLTGRLASRWLPEHGHVSPPRRSPRQRAHASPANFVPQVALPPMPAVPAVTVPQMTLPPMPAAPKVAVPLPPMPAIPSVLPKLTLPPMPAVVPSVVPKVALPPMPSVPTVNVPMPFAAPPPSA